MKTALILGAKSGIAKSLAMELAMRKIDMVWAARNALELRGFSTEVEDKFDIKVELREFDALKLESHKPFVESLAKEIDAVFCVFGYLGNQQKAEVDEVERNKIIDTNYTGAVSVLALLAARFEQNKHGFIIGISSVAGERVRASNYFYGSSKASFTAYLKNLSKRLQSSNVKVITVKPGYVNTPMVTHLNLPSMLVISPERAAKDILVAMDRGQSEVYVPGIWRYVAAAVNLIPESLFKRMKF
ncbi:MAG TPA: SDR family NAD(P)-dependent oxidoreductase [Chitinophagales bacterium]|nr:SDR family NAD(P)-dependent oxidoreductase [Chitinophagales bacterium]